MQQPKRWWVGLIALVPLWYYCAASNTDQIEAKVAVQAKAALAATGAGGETPAIAVAGRDVTLSGDAESAQAAATAAKTVVDARGVRLVNARLAALPAAKPYVFGARRDGDTLTLEGSAPSAAARGKAADAAKAAMPAAKLVDKLALAAGAPGDYDAAQAFAVRQAARLDQSVATISDGGFSISGQAPTFEAYDAALAATKALPAGLTLAKADILPPVAKPFVWGATREGDAVTLTGYAPSDAALAAIARQAQMAFPQARIDNRMRLAAGAPQGDFGASASYALNQLATLAKGAVGYSDDAYTIAGQAPTADAYDAALAATRTLPAGVRLAKADILPPVAKPYLWGASREGDLVTLMGSAPSADAVAAIGEQAQSVFPNGKIDNRLRVAAGAPQGDFPAATQFALGELGKLSQGRVGYTDSAFSISGLGLEGVTNESVAAAAKSGLPKGFETASVDVNLRPAKPYLFNAQRDGDKLTLEGYAPSEPARARLAAAAKAAVPGAGVVDRLKLAGGAPADYDAGAAYAMAQAWRLERGHAAISDGAFTIAGEAPSFDAYDAALAATKTLPAGLTLAKADILPPAIKPYVWGATHEGDAVTLTGYAPSSDVRADIVRQAAATFPKARVVDQMRVARGAPQTDMPAATRFALGELARLSQGRVGYQDTAFSISGLGLEGVDSDAVAADARSGLPKGYAVGAVDVREPATKPYVFSAERAGQRVALSGYYPDQKLRAAIVDETKARFPGATLDDRMKRAAGAPDDYARALEAGLGQLSRLPRGVFAIDDRKATLKGHATSQALADDVRRAFVAAQPKGYAGVAEITFDAPPPPPVLPPPPPPPLVNPPVVAPPVVAPPAPVVVAPAPDKAAICQADLRGALARENVQFDTARATIKAESRRMLDDISAIAKRCLGDGGAIEISGHTDARGARDMNMRLSQQRAEAVRDYMIKVGVAADRLTAAGYGPDRPVASNDTPEGRAQNRRIDMTVKAF
jgi:OOP family OmpA-OmpF porin